jgi:two-component system response regulator PilR (NtrC family)
MAEKALPRILVVDDSPETLELFKLQLGDKYDVETTISLKAASEKLETQRFHIAIVDLVLPGENGLDLIKDIAQNHPFTAVLPSAARLR